MEFENSEKFFLEHLTGENLYVIWFIRNKKRNFDMLQDIVAKKQHHNIEGLYFD